MTIANLNERVVIEKNETMIDDNANHINTWVPYFSCAAYAMASSYQQREGETAGLVTSEDGLVFQVRYCSELANLDSTHYRVNFKDKIYNITSVDMSNFDHKTLKISASRERESDSSNKEEWH